MGQSPPNSYDDRQTIALERVLQTLREEENAEVLIETTLNYLQTEYDYRLIWIGLYDRLDHRLFGKGGVIPTGDMSFLKQRFNLNPGDILEQVVIQQRPVGVPDLQQETRAGEWQRIAQSCGVQGTLLFPIRCKDRCFGVVLLGSETWGISPRQGEKAAFSIVFGGLAAALYQIESDWQRSSTKRADQPLFNLLEQLLQLPTLTARLESIVAMTQSFITPTRTNIYWYSPEKRYFWHRVGNRQMARGLETRHVNAAGITVAEATDFYQTLARGSMVAIGATRSPLKAESTGKILSRLKARSLLAAPISAKPDLLGFLAVEDSQPRIWEEAERNYIRAIAQLVAIVSVNEDLEATLEQSQRDTIFSQTIAQIIFNSSNSSDARSQATSLLNKRLETDYVFVLQEEPGGVLKLIHQAYPPDRHPLTAPLERLTPSDRDIIFQKDRETLEIEDIQESSHLRNWLPTFSNLGLRSLIISVINTPGPGEEPSLLIFAQSNPRTWNSLECSLISIVTGQLRMLGNFFAAREQVSKSQLISQTLEDGLKTLWSLPKNPKKFTSKWLEYLATVSTCPLVSLWQWGSGEVTKPNLELGFFKLTDLFVAPGLNLPKNLVIPAADPLIQLLLQQDSGLIYLTTADLSVTMRKLFHSVGLEQLLFIALPRTKSRKKSSSPTDKLERKEVSSRMIFLFADQQKISTYLWTGQNPVLVTLLQHFVLTLNYQQRHAIDSQERSNLQALNWYKHCSLSLLHQSMVERITSLLQVDPKATLGEGMLGGVRTTQVLRQLESILTTLNPLLTQELWELKTDLTSVPLVSLIKRSLRNLESVCQQRQIIPEVLNNLAGSAYADRWKLECIIFEVLLTCIFQATPGNRLTILTKAVVTSPEMRSAQLLEILIIEKPPLSENALENPPALVPNTDNQQIIFHQLPPILHSQICQQILHSWGGDLQFGKSPEGNFSTRLILLATP